MNEQFTKRLKSFAWRFSMATAVFSVEWISANVGLLDLSPFYTGVIALVAGEVSKYLNTKK